MANLQAKDGAGTSIFIKATGTGTNADPFSTESRTNVLNFPASQPVTDVNIGTTTDTAATTDTGTFSLIALVKRLLGKLPTLVSGRFPVDGSGVTQPISATTLPLPTGAAVDTTLQAVRDRMPATLGAKTSAQSLAVTLSTDGVFATAFGAAVDAAATTDTANTGFVSLFKRILGKLPSALVNGRFVVDATVRTAANNPLQYNAIGTTAGANIKNATGVIYSLSCINLNAASRYVLLFNKATAPAANDVPVESFVVYPSGGQLLLGQDYFSLNGLDLSSGISWGISTTPTLYTAATAADTIFTARYL